MEAAAGSFTGLHSFLGYGFAIKVHTELSRSLMCVRVVFGFITVLVIVVVVAAVFSNTIIAPALPGSTIVCT